MYIKIIENYLPKNEQEEVDKKTMLEFIFKNDDHLLRSNKIGHFTISSIVINFEATKVLFAYHNIYQSWSWLGGHADGDRDFLNVSIKEALEESGINKVVAVFDEPFILDIINVENHYKNKKYVSDHLHLNLTYLLVADEKAALTPKLDENKAVSWFTFEEVFNVIKEDRMIPIYQKAFSYISNNKFEILNKISKLKKQLL